MTQQELNDLIDKVNNGTATDEDLGLYTTYLNHITSGDEAWDVQELGTEESVKNELQNRIELIRKPIGTKKARLWPRIAAVAAAIALIVLGVLFFNSDRGVLKQVQDDVVVNDIAPGKNGATITLGNGKVIQLSDAKSGVVVGEEIKYDGGTALSGLQPSLPGGERSEALTASTTKGQTYQFTLPDGTKVWLNADSKLEFPSNFVNSKTRNVRLVGEGYFEVAKDKTHPFIVATDKQTVEVLGTHFNINGYADEASVKTTLVEGSVRVFPLSAMGRDAEGREVNGKSTTLSGRSPSLPEGDRSVVLKPNQQSVLTGSNRIDVKQVDVENIIAWQKGYFMFNNETLENIMRRVARWYDVDVIYETEQPKGVTYYGTVSRFENISKVLSKLQATSNVKFKIEGNKIYISK